jgi:hypothetical protein
MVLTWSQLVICDSFRFHWGACHAIRLHLLLLRHPDAQGSVGASPSNLYVVTSLVVSLITEFAMTVSQTFLTCVLGLSFVLGSSGCGAKAAAEKAEKERASKYLGAVLEIVQARAPGTTGQRADEEGMKAIEQLEALPSEGVPAEVIQTAQGLTAWLKKGIEIEARGELTKEAMMAWMKEGESWNLAAGSLRQKYKPQ